MLKFKKKFVVWDGEWWLGWKCYFCDTYTQVMRQLKDSYTKIALPSLW
jgi:hypothetical protein